MNRNQAIHESTNESKLSNPETNAISNRDKDEQGGSVRTSSWRDNRWWCIRGVVVADRCGEDVEKRRENGGGKEKKIGSGV